MTLRTLGTWIDVVQFKNKENIESHIQVNLDWFCEILAPTGLLNFSISLKKKRQHHNTKVYTMIPSEGELRDTMELYFSNKYIGI